MAIVYPETYEECKFFAQWHIDNAWDTYIKANETRDEETIKKCVRQGTFGELIFSMINGGIFPVKINRNGDNGIDTFNELIGKIQLKTTSDHRYVYDDGYRKDDFPQADYCYAVVGYYDQLNDIFEYYYDLPSNILKKWKVIRLNDGRDSLVLDKHDLFKWESIQEAYARYGKIESIHPVNDLNFDEE